MGKDDDKDFDDIPQDDEDPKPEDDSSDDDSDLSDSESSSSEGDNDTGLTENQNRLLYLLSLYTHAAQSEDEKEEWVRKPALMVLMYEGIVAQVLDYDYAPSSELVESRRKYFNITQEGKSDVDFLREEELLNGLKLSSKSYQPVTCYQISDKGMELVKRISKADKEAVHELVYAPGTRELLRVEWDGDEYHLKSSSFGKTSSVTDTEDVSYVSSAYVPQCLRHGGRPTLSNAHRAHESGGTDTNIRDELDEVITLNSVSIIVAEYIPFGANQIVALNTNLGSTERVQGGFFTALVDNDASGTKFEVPPGLTSVNILDYTLTDHINFEADIHFPEPPGVVQVETFGVSINADGCVFYGMQVEAVMERIKDNISLDHLSRLLVDVQQDSSQIVDSVISSYQRSLMDLIFMGDAENRDKVNLIIANEITPHLTAEEYMDKGEYENELKQVIGDTRAAFDISEHDTLIFGAHGLLIAGPNSRHHEPLLCAYIQFLSMDIFVRNYFGRLFIILDDMKTTRKTIDANESDPNSMVIIRSQMTQISKEIILMEEILGYMDESLDSMGVPPEPPEQAGRSLYERLQIRDMKEQSQRRVHDLKKTMVGTRHSLEMLREMSNIVSETKMFQLQQAINVNTANLCQLNAANEKASRSLEYLQYVLCGSLAFDILDRFTGEWTIVNTEWARGFVEPVIKNTPGIWFGISLFMWLLVATYLQMAMKKSDRKARSTLVIRQAYVRKINTLSLGDYLKSKKLDQESFQYDVSRDIVKATWTEKKRGAWGGFKPTITLEYDQRNSYLLSLEIHYNKAKANKGQAFSASQLVERLHKDMEESKFYDESEEKAKSNARGETSFGNRGNPDFVDNFGGAPKEDDEPKEADEEDAKKK